jgi:hypothetical protein
LVKACFAFARDIQHINAVLHCSHPAGLFQLSNFSDRCNPADEGLFNKICSNNNHILHQYLPDTSDALKKTQFATPTTSLYSPLLTAPN